jgi:hypothetical protein
MQIDNQIASHRWRLRHANSNHIPDGTLATDEVVDCNRCTSFVALQETGFVALHWSANGTK